MKENNMQLPDRTKLYPFLFRPFYKPVVWGGNMLQSVLHRELPKSELPIGEAWEIVDRADVTSIVTNGALTGVTLNQLVKHYKTDFVSANFNKERFPILIKLIDAGQRLSLQVHPDERGCALIQNGAEPKTEMWYIIAAQKNAQILAGLSKSTTKTQFMDFLHTTEIESTLQIFQSAPGDAYYIKAGRVHAIGAGNLLLEIQQNSDTTFRISDWGRLGSNGKPRKLHLENAMKCIDFMDRTTPRITAVANEAPRNRKYPLTQNCPFFNVDNLLLSETWIDNTHNSQSAHLITPINHSVSIENEHTKTNVPRGRTCLIPACMGKYQINLDSNIATTLVKTTL